MTPVLKKQSTQHFMAETVKFALTAGLIISFVSLLVYVNFVLFQDRIQLYGKTASVIVIIFMNLYVILSVATAERREPFTQFQPWIVWAIIAIALIAAVLVVYLPIPRSIFGMVALDADSWITIVAVSGVGIWLLHVLLKKMRLNNNANSYF